MRYIFSMICLLVQVSCMSQAEIQKKTTSQTTQFDEAMLLQNIKTLSSDSFEGRRTGTKGAIRAKKYIISQFKTLNIVPLANDFEQPFSFTSKGKNYQGVNVLGLIKGTDYPENYIVISAHYDHEGIKYGKIYNGTDDNASGISALFSFAEYFKNNPPKHSVILAAFDAEELGLKGSKYYVDNPIIPLKNIMINFNFDMISRSDKNQLFAVGTSYSEILKDVILNTKYSTKIELLTGHDNRLNWKSDWTNSSDHASFHKKDIPFLYFGVDDHEDYHKPTDDYENIQPEFFIEAVKITISVFEKIDDLQIKR